MLSSDETDTAGVWHYLQYRTTQSESPVSSIPIIGLTELFTFLLTWVRFLFGSKPLQSCFLADILYAID